MSKITIYDIAKALDVNASTVNRAINGKPGVGEKKKRMILDYAQKHGYKANQAAKSLNRNVKFAFVTKSTVGVFDKQLIQGINAAYCELEGYNVSLDIFRAETNDEFLSRLSGLKDSGYSAVVVQPIKSDELDDICSGLLAAGIPVATVVSDISPECRTFTVHLDGFMAGSTAAELLKLGGCSKSAYFCGDKEYRIHRDMIDGFRAFCKANGISITEVYDDNAETDKARENCRHMLASHKDVQGIFIGTANSVPICEEIEASGRDIRIISMDVFKEISQFIKEGTVSASLYQQPSNQSYSAMKRLYLLIQEAATPRDEIIAPEIVLQSTIDKFNDII